MTITNFWSIFFMTIDLKRSIDRRLLFKSGATFIRQGPLLTWSKWVGEPDYTFILRWPRYLGADMWGAEKVICYLPVYSEPVSCRPVELPSICLSWRTTILRYIVKDNTEYIHIEYIPAKDIPLTTILHTCFDITPPYLIFVIFFTRAKFLESKIYTKKRQFFALNL